MEQTLTPVRDQTPTDRPSPAIAKFEARYTQSCVDKNNPQNYVCKRGWINCMPGGTSDEAKYCSDDYAKWAKKNCGGEPLIAM